MGGSGSEQCDDLPFCWLHLCDETARSGMVRRSYSIKQPCCALYLLLIIASQLQSSTGESIDFKIHYKCGSWFMYRQHQCVYFEVHMSPQSRDGFFSIPLAYRPGSPEMPVVSLAR